MHYSIAFFRVSFLFIYYNMLPVSGMLPESAAPFPSAHNRQYESDRDSQIHPLAPAINQILWLYCKKLLHPAPAIWETYRRCRRASRRKSPSLSALSLIHICQTMKFIIRKPGIDHCIISGHIFHIAVIKKELIIRNIKNALFQPFILIHWLPINANLTIVRPVNPCQKPQKC